MQIDTVLGWNDRARKYILVGYKLFDDEEQIEQISSHDIPGYSQEGHARSYILLVTVNRCSPIPRFPIFSQWKFLN